MHLFERESIEQPFVSCGPAIPVVVGQRGIAWGLGVHSVPDDLSFERIKREGDRKAPAGIFRLGPIFIDSRFPLSKEFRMPTVIVDEYWEAIDDPESRFYNQLLNASSIEVKDWRSSEIMHRDDELYRFGLVIQHNSDPAIPGGGSCIFMHSWRGNEKGSYGCTALDSSSLLGVLSWLDPRKAPLIVQLPFKEFRIRAGEWNLPALNSSN